MNAGSLTIRQFHEGLVSREFSACEALQSVYAAIDEQDAIIGAYLSTDRDAAFPSLVSRSNPGALPPHCNQALDPVDGDQDAEDKHRQLAVARVRLEDREHGGNGREKKAQDD